MSEGIYVIEFQKRGLPHAHILIFFAEDYKPHMVEDVNHMISVEFPNLETNKLAHKTVIKCMMHGPCGVAFPNAPCMEDDKCKKIISTQVPIQDNDECKWLSYLSTQKYRVHSFGSWR
jgi:hypothetical protein